MKGLVLSLFLCLAIGLQATVKSGVCGICQDHQLAHQLQLPHTHEHEHHHEAPCHEADSDHSHESLCQDCHQDCDCSCHVFVDDDPAILAKIDAPSPPECHAAIRERPDSWVSPPVPQLCQSSTRGPPDLIDASSCHARLALWMRWRI